MDLKVGDRVYYGGSSTPGHERPVAYGVVYSIFPEDPQGRTTVFVQESHDKKVRPHWLHQLEKK